MCCNFLSKGAILTSPTCLLALFAVRKVLRRYFWTCLVAFLCGLDADVRLSSQQLLAHVSVIFQNVCHTSCDVTRQFENMATEEERRKKALEDYRKKLIEHRELDTKLKKSKTMCILKVHM